MNVLLAARIVILTATVSLADEDDDAAFWDGKPNSPIDPAKFFAAFTFKNAEAASVLGQDGPMSVVATPVDTASNEARPLSTYDLKSGFSNFFQIDDPSNKLSFIVLPKWIGTPTTTKDGYTLIKAGGGELGPVGAAGAMNVQFNSIPEAAGCEERQAYYVVVTPVQLKYTYHASTGMPHVVSCSCTEDSNFYPEEIRKKCPKMLDVKPSIGDLFCILFEQRCRAVLKARGIVYAQAMLEPKVNDVMKDAISLNRKNNFVMWLLMSFKDVEYSTSIIQDVFEPLVKGKRQRPRYFNKWTRNSINWYYSFPLSESKYLLKTYDDGLATTYTLQIADVTRVGFTSPQKSEPKGLLNLLKSSTECKKHRSNMLMFELAESDFVLAVQRQNVDKEVAPPAAKFIGGGCKTESHMTYVATNSLRHMVENKCMTQAEVNELKKRLCESITLMLQALLRKYTLPPMTGLPDVDIYTVKDSKAAKDADKAKAFHMFFEDAFSQERVGGSFKKDGWGTSSVKMLFENMLNANGKLQ